jgi:hypothetical protein
MVNHGALAFSGNVINPSCGVPMADVLGTNGTPRGVKSPPPPHCEFHCS